MIMNVKTVIFYPVFSLIIYLFLLQWVLLLCYLMYHLISWVLSYCGGLGMTLIQIYTTDIIGYLGPATISTPLLLVAFGFCFMEPGAYFAILN